MSEVHLHASSCGEDGAAAPRGVKIERDNVIEPTLQQSPRGEDSNNNNDAILGPPKKKRSTKPRAGREHLRKGKWT